MGLLNKVGGEKTVILIALLVLGLAFGKWMLLIAIFGVSLVFILEKMGYKVLDKE